MDTLGKRYMNTGRLVAAMGRLRDGGTLLPLLRSGALVLALGGLLLLAGCDLFNGGPGSNQKSPAQVPWCDSHSAPRFQDDSTAAQTVLTKWSDVKDQLGFTVYLPDSLPNGSCLALAGGSIHDPIYGGHFELTYNLPTTGPLAFSEAPKRAGMADKVQCVPSSQDAKTTICQGVISGTSVTLAARETQSQLQTVFSSLKANVDWVPQVTATPSTPTNTPVVTPSTPVASPTH